MRAAALRFAAFAVGLVLAIEGLHAAVKAWHDGLAALDPGEIILVTLLPLWAVLWWRLSVFSHPRPRCLAGDEVRATSTPHRGIES